MIRSESNFPCEEHFDLIESNSVFAHERNFQLLLTDIYVTQRNLNLSFMEVVFVM